ncbi:MAG: RNA 2'-phosphotransferase [Pseudomonadota bacterium]
MNKSNTKHSKFLSLVLRHKPEEIGLTLAPGGWVEVDALLKGMAEAGRPITRSKLEEVVRTNDKKRFSLSEDGKRIRAAQGHSAKVDMQMVPATPPEFLYHGTATRFLDAILADGLKPMSRQHVHLSLEYQTAHKVGSRHGRPVILTIESGRMKTEGHEFYRADNGVWLTDRVPPDYLKQDT